MSVSVARPGSGAVLGFNVHVHFAVLVVVLFVGFFLRGDVHTPVAVDFGGVLFLRGNVHTPVDVDFCGTAWVCGAVLGFKVHFAVLFFVLIVVVAGALGVSFGDTSLAGAVARVEVVWGEWK